MESHEKRILILAVVLLLIFFGSLAYAYRTYGVRIPSCVTDVRPFDSGKIIRRGELDYEIQMLARMWKFEPAEVTLPPGSHVTLYLSTADVVHGMQILGTNVNLMAIPGSVNFAEVTFDKEGTYRVLCHEYCGRNHQNMAGQFVITADAPVEPPEPAASPGTLSDDAQALFEEYLCLSCHTLDGSDEELAPTFKGLYGSTRTLTDGSTVIADEDYLIDSIVHPENHVTQGYEPMPEVGEIPEADLRVILDALRQLSE